MKDLLRLFLLVCASASAAFAQDSYRGMYRVEVDGPVRVSRRSGGESVWTYTITRRDVSGVTIVRRSVPYDVARPAAFVFESGRLLLVHGADGIAELYDKRGDLRTRTSLTEVPQPDPERAVLVAMHEKTAVMSISDAQGSGITLVRLDEEGTIVTRRELEGVAASGIAIAEDPELHAVSALRWNENIVSYTTHIVRGAEVWTAPVGFKKAVFDERDRLYGMNDNEAFGLSLRGKAIVWRMQEEAGRVVLDAAITTDGVSLLSAGKPEWSEGKWIYTAPMLKQVDKGGIVISDVPLPRAKFSRGELLRVAGQVSVLLDGQPVK